MTFASRRVPEIVTDWEDRASRSRAKTREVHDTSSIESVASQKIAESQAAIPEHPLPYTRGFGHPLPLSPSPGGPGPDPHHWRQESNTDTTSKTSSSPSSPTLSASTAKSHAETGTGTQASRPGIPSPNTEFDSIKAESARLQQQRNSCHQSMPTLKAQLRLAQDQADEAIADNSGLRQEISRLRLRVQNSREEEERLNAEIDRMGQREMELMDRMEAALSARLRGLRLLEEGMASGGKGGLEFIVARSVRPGKQKGKHRSGRKQR